MVEIQIAYKGNLHCQATHVDSGAHILTDAPKDNMGEGKSFSPTDMVATALGTCMITTMGIAALRMNIDLTGTTAKVIKEMTPPPRRIGELRVTLNFPMKLSEEQKEKLRNAAMTCPVARSLHPDVQMPVEFNFA